MLEITPQQLQASLQNDTLRPYLLDVREPSEFEICHIAGAHLIPSGQVPMNLEELPRDCPIVVICHHGIRSYMIAMYLERQGFEQVSNLHGGIAAWAQNIDLDMPMY
jgi:rhodanese-related sulfurtransferase